MESILNSIKKMLGLDANYTPFDQELIIFINSAFARLRQLGAGPYEGFAITGPGETWDTYLDGRLDLLNIQSYVYLHVRRIFDPPQNGFAVTAIKEEIDKLEWCINVAIESPV